mmetsp:Transcript_6814/g.16100  ORF Transcript_6814/g.16100 Transcript_6814/m.16100 type:complete len:265 (-) Transcript_6814:861-1655(-)
MHMPHILLLASLAGEQVRCLRERHVLLGGLRREVLAVQRRRGFELHDEPLPQAQRRVHGDLGGAFERVQVHEQRLLPRRVCGELRERAERGGLRRLRSGILQGVRAVRAVWGDGEAPTLPDPADALFPHPGLHPLQGLPVRCPGLGPNTTRLWWRRLFASGVCADHLCHPRCLPVSACGHCQWYGLDRKLGGDHFALPPRVRRPLGLCGQLHPEPGAAADRRGGLLRHLAPGEDLADSEAPHGRRRGFGHLRRYPQDLLRDGGL